MLFYVEFKMVSSKNSAIRGLANYLLLQSGGFFVYQIFEKFVDEWLKEMDTSLISSFGLSPHLPIFILFMSLSRSKDERLTSKMKELVDSMNKKRKS